MTDIGWSCCNRSLVRDGTVEDAFALMECCLLLHLQNRLWSVGVPLAYSHSVWYILPVSGHTVTEIKTFQNHHLNRVTLMQ